MQRSHFVNVLLFGLIQACLLAGCAPQVTPGPTGGARLEPAVAASATRPATVPAFTSNPTPTTEAIVTAAGQKIPASATALSASATATRTSLPPTATATAVAAQTPVVPSIRLDQASNLRAGPGTSYPIVGTARAGEVLMILARDPAGNWWQVQGGWVCAALGLATVSDAQLPVASNIPPAPSPTRTPSPAPAATATQTATTVPTALPSPGIVDTVVLGQETKYPVRARSVIGWGYELVDASDQYDLIVHRDVYGVMAHKAWDSLFQRHQHGIRITLIDPIRLDECRRFWGSNPALAPIPLSHRNRGRCDDLVLPGGFGDGQGAGIAVGCTWDDPDSPVHVQTDPEECFIAVVSPGPHLTDISVTASVVGYNWVKAGSSSQMTPDLAAEPFSPLLGQAYREGDQWRWRDPYLEVVPAAH